MNAKVWGFKIVLYVGIYLLQYLSYEYIYKVVRAIPKYILVNNKLIEVEHFRGGQYKFK